MAKDKSNPSTHSASSTDYSIHDDEKEILDELHGNTDRSLAILSAAKIDEILLSILTLRLLAYSGKDKDDPLLGRERPLESLSSRIKTTYRFGCIREDLFRCLEIIRSIRNDFAHKGLVNSFDDEVNSSKIQTLRKLCGPNPAIDDIVLVLIDKGFGTNTSNFLASVWNGVIPALRVCESHTVRVEESSHGVKLSKVAHDAVAEIVQQRKGRDSQQ